jgi:hypothetical protein
MRMLNRWAAILATMFKSGCFSNGEIFETRLDKNPEFQNVVKHFLSTPPKKPEPLGVSANQSLPRLCVANRASWNPNQICLSAVRLFDLGTRLLRASHMPRQSPARM